MYGGFTYTENLSRFIEKALSLLEVGGAVYTVLPAVHLEDGADKLGAWYKTELVDAASRRVTVCSWLKQTTCAKVTCESKTDWDEPSAADKDSQSLQRRYGAAHEACGIHSGGSSRQAIPIGAVG